MNAALPHWLSPRTLLPPELRAAFCTYESRHVLPVVRIIYLIGAVVPLVYLLGDLMMESQQVVAQVRELRFGYLAFWACLYWLTFLAPKRLPVGASYPIYTLVGLVVTCEIERWLQRPEYIIATSLLYLIGLVVARASPAIIATCGAITVVVPAVMLPWLHITPEIVNRVTFFHVIWAVTSTIAGIVTLRLNVRLFLAEHLLSQALDDARQAHEQERLLRQEMEHRAQTDPLTGLFNRRAFYQRAAPALEQARRYQRPLSLLMLDIDHFKRINDTHGHAIGDLVIQRVATICSTLVREADTAARFGGEEFVILLPETEAPAAQSLAERLRIEAAASVTADVVATVSIGVATLTAEDAVDALIVRADRALYQAKTQGRNRICIG